MKRSTHIAAIAAIALGLSSGVALGGERPYTDSPYRDSESGEWVVVEQAYSFEQLMRKTASEMFPKRSVRFESLNTNDGRAIYKVTIGDNGSTPDGSLGISKAQDESNADGY